MIVPTVGRIVWFYEHVAQDRPFAAIVCRVHGPACVNVAWFDPNGNVRSATSVKLLQDGEDRPQYGYFAEWMPYQRDQAARAEASQAAPSATS